MYKQGNLVGTLESVAKQICPSQHIPSHGSPVSKKKLTFNCQKPRRKPPPPPHKPTPAVKKVEALDVFDATDPTHVTIPDEFGNVFDHIADRYVNTISSSGVTLTTPFNTNNHVLSVTKLDTPLMIVLFYKMSNSFVSIIYNLSCF